MTLHTHAFTKKYRIAILLSTIAVFSVAYALTRGSAPSDVGILTAIAAEQSSNYRMFLKLDAVPGESADPAHRGEIEIDSYAWRESRSVGASRPTFDEFRITIPTNKASGKLMLYTAANLKSSYAIISVRRSGSSKDFLKWILTDVSPVSYQTVGNVHGDGTTDQVAFAANKVEFEYYPADGSSVVKAGWDLRTGKSVSY